MPEAVRSSSAPRRGPDPAFWSGKRVLLTGHTGFIGAWAALWLERMEAVVTGLAQLPEHSPNLYGEAGVAASLASQLVDLRDRPRVVTLMELSRLDLVLHLAAQASVQESVADPGRTFATNVMGTVNLLDALRRQSDLKAVLTTTSNAVHALDPYSASKAACEIVVASYAATYFESRGVAVGVARAGAVIGGGDYAADRATGDAPRGAGGQHVLDCVAGHLVYLEALATEPDTPRTVARFESRLDAAQAAAWTEDWNRAVSEGARPRRAILDQIAAYEALY